MAVMMLFGLLFSSLVAAAPWAANTSASCKVVSGDATWPAPEVWTKELPGVQAIEQDPEGPKRPNYSLVAKTIEDVQAAVKFSAQYNIRLAIVNSGLDFLGRSDAPTGLSLMVGNFKGVRVSPSFTPSAEGVKNVDYASDPIQGVNSIKPIPGSQAVVTFGVGVTSQQLNNALAKSGLFTMTAMESTVKVAGGYSQTAGHGPFTNKYGLAAENMVEYKVITADGKLRVANVVSEPELFWALRGGGGGTFGVVVEATMNAFPSPRVTLTRWWYSASDPADSKSIYAPTAWLLGQLPELNRKYGVQGYFFMYPNGSRFTMLTADEQSGIETANKTWAPVWDKLATFPGMKRPIYRHDNFPNFKSMFDSFFGPLEEVPNPTRYMVNDLEEAFPRGIIPLDSRLLSEKHLTDPRLAQVLADAMPKSNFGQLRGHLTAGGAVLNTSVEATSVNPAWRKAWIHLIGTGDGIPDVTSLKNLALDSGCYANETNFKEVMFGSHYAKLLSIKKKYDPSGLFWVSPGIGADEFVVNPTTGRVCAADETTLAMVKSETANGMAPLFDNRVMGPHESGTYELGPESQAIADKEMAASAAALAAALAGKGSPAPSPKGKGTASAGPAKASLEMPKASPEPPKGPAETPKAVAEEPKASPETSVSAPKPAKTSAPKSKGSPKNGFKGTSKGTSKSKGKGSIPKFGSKGSGNIAVAEVLEVEDDQM